MAMSKFAMSAAVLGACLSGAAAQGSSGTVVGEAQPGTMEETFTVPYTEYDSDTAAKEAGCGITYAGCHGTFHQKSHAVAGEVTVLDDCTFRIQGWQFDGLGPAVEWCARNHCHFA